MDDNEERFLNEMSCGCKFTHYPEAMVYEPCNDACRFFKFVRETRAKSDLPSVYLPSAVKTGGFR